MVRWAIIIKSWSKETKTILNNKLITEITTNNSIKVNPFLELRFFLALVILWHIRRLVFHNCLYFITNDFFPQERLFLYPTNPAAGPGLEPGLNAPGASVLPKLDDPAVFKLFFQCIFLWQLAHISIGYKFWLALFRLCHLLRSSGPESDVNYKLHHPAN